MCDFRSIEEISKLIENKIGVTLEFVSHIDEAKNPIENGIYIVGHSGAGYVGYYDGKEVDLGLGFKFDLY